MKTSVERAIRDQNGNVLILVLVVLVVGGLILGPLLGLMGTGLVAGQVYERKTAELYAADAGVEDAIWKIKHGQIPSDEYNLTVNNREVRVTIVTTDTTQFLVDLLNITEKNWVHSDWVVLGRTLEKGKFEITISWDGEGNASLDGVGAWLSGTYSYLEGQVIPEADIRDEYPAYALEEKDFSGGTAFIWTWDAQSDKPSFTRETPPKTLTFQFTPWEIPSVGIAFTTTVRQNVGLSYDGDFTVHMITAIATSTAGTQTTIVARAISGGCGHSEIVLLNWNLS